MRLPLHRVAATTAWRTAHLLLAGGAVSVFLAMALVPTDAAAQPGWLSDRNAGPGFRVGRLEIHPSVSAEIGYDSNVFLQDTNTEGSAVLRLTGGVSLTTLGAERQQEAETTTPPRVEFGGGLNVAFLHYFNTSNRSNVAGDLNLRLSVLPAGRFGFTLTETLSRTVRPFVDASAASNPSYGQNISNTALLFHLQSPGRTLVGHLGYRLGATFFDSSIFNANNSLTHTVVSDMSWTFFPRTALLWDFSTSFLRYMNDDEAYQLLQDATIVRTSAGVNGVLSTKVSARLMLGYVAALYAGDTTDDFDGITARAELRLRPRDTISLNFGYAHDLAPSFIGNFVTQDSLYAQLQMMFAGRVLLGLQLTGSYNRSGVALQADGTSLLGNSLRRKDFRTTAQLYGEYRVLSWLAILAQVEYQGDITDYRFELPVTMPGSVIPDPGAGYQRVEAWLGARVSY